MGSGDVEDGKSRGDLSGLPRDFPSIKPAQQTDVGHERAVFALVSSEQGHRFFAGSRDSRFKTAISKSVFNNDLNRWVVFNNQDNKQFFQRPNSPTIRWRKTSRRSRDFVPAKCTKVNLRALAKLRITTEFGTCGLNLSLANPALTN